MAGETIYTGDMQPCYAEYSFPAAARQAISLRAPGLVSPGLRVTGVSPVFRFPDGGRVQKKCKIRKKVCGISQNILHVLQERFFAG